MLRSWLMVNPTRLLGQELVEHRLMTPPICESVESYILLPATRWGRRRLARGGQRTVGDGATPSHDTSQDLELKPLQSSRVLLVGCGFIGSRVAELLLGTGVQLTILTRTESSRSARLGAFGSRVVIGDAADDERLGECLDGVDTVVYCAGGLLPATSVRHPRRDLDLTIQPLRGVLRRLRRREHARLIFLSSGGTVYGHPERLPITEDHPLRPIVPYGASRVRAEQLIESAARVSGIRATTLRLGNVYGSGQPHDREQGVVAVFLAAARTGAPALMYGDGSVARDYVHVDDVADVVVGVSVLPEPPPVLNVGSGQATQLVELAEMVSAVSGRPLLLQRRPARAYDVPRIELDISRLRALLAFHPLSIEEGLRRIWAARLDELMPGIHAVG